MMAPPRKGKWHLLRKVKGHSAACGLKDPRLATTEIERVTCEGCKRSVVMADALVRENMAPRNIKRRR